MKPTKFLDWIRNMGDRSPRIAWNIAFIFAFSGAILLYDIVDSLAPFLIPDLSAKQLLVRFSLTVLVILNFLAYFPSESTKETPIDA